MTPRDGERDPRRRVRSLRAICRRCYACYYSRLISGRIVRYFREEAAEPLPSARYRSMSGTRMGQPGTGIASETGTTGVGGCRSRSYRFRSPGAPLDRVQALTTGRPAATAASEPRLTIIDFNQLTRGGLELATSRNRATVARRSVKSRR